MTIAANPPGKYNSLNGFKQPDDTTSAITGNLDNQLYIYGSVDLGGTLINATYLLNTLNANVATAYSTATAIAISGLAFITGGTGLAMTLAAPEEGSQVDITLATLSSGSVTVKTPAGVTFDGTNNTATFGTAGNRLIVKYLSATRWLIVYNSGVTFSST